MDFGLIKVRIRNGHGSARIIQGRIPIREAKDYDFTVLVRHSSALVQNWITVLTRVDEIEQRPLSNGNVVVL